MKALAAGLVLAVSGCSGDGIRAATAAPVAGDGPRAPIDLVTDSVLPMHVLCQRFRSGLPVAVALENGAHSADELIERFMSAVERSDYVTLAQIAVSRAEYAWLYFPTSVYATAPYELPPDVAWTLSAAASKKGLTRVVRRLGGTPLRFHVFHCAQEAREGPNRFWRQCTVQYEQATEGHFSRRLFGTIMERDGRFKFLSYANDF
jgi:hypothetical protein